MQIISYNVNLSNYFKRLETHHDRLQMNYIIKYQQSTSLKIYF
jgi:hypothetical protein